jgi:hypothetical protein
MAGFPAVYFGRIYPMMLVQMWLATAVSQAWSAWSKTLVQAYTALWAAGLIFYAFSGTQAALGTVSPALRWMADINYWRWCLQFVVSVGLSRVLPGKLNSDDFSSFIVLRSGKSCATTS